MADNNVEVEVKFLVSDLAAFRERLVVAGGVLRRERIHEYNIRFDTPAEALRNQSQLLRLRRDTAAIVTFKGPSPDDAGSEAKVREELEIEVSDFETAAAIFQRLGFEVSQVYEKYRETFQLDEIEVVLDEMPFGNFVELEGEEAAIKTAAETLELDWRKRIVTNYLTLMGQLKDHHDLPFNDLTFDNFKDLSISVADILPR